MKIIPSGNPADRNNRQTDKRGWFDRKDLKSKERSGQTYRSGEEFADRKQFKKWRADILYVHIQAHRLLRIR
jgi:hypothetical protein